MSKPKGAATMKWLAQVTLLMIALGAITLAGAAQDNSAPPSPRAQPQTERERKEQERQRKKEEKEAAKRQQQQVGVRCARVRKKN
jgi:ribosomal protein L12E/L44/L45/RPP1/RPP2